MRRLLALVAAGTGAEAAGTSTSASSAPFQSGGTPSRAVGPDRAGNLLEVIWLELGGDELLVIHAVRLRATFSDCYPLGRPRHDEHARDEDRPCLSDADIDALADEVESTNSDVEQLKARRRGRPPMGSAPAQVVPVRIDPELEAAIEARAAADQTTTSEVIREALRRFLDVA